MVTVSPLSLPKTQSLGKARQAPCSLPHEHTPASPPGGSAGYPGLTLRLHTEVPAQMFLPQKASPESSEEFPELLHLFLSPDSS